MKLCGESYRYKDSYLCYLFSILKSISFQLWVTLQMNKKPSEQQLNIIPTGRFIAASGSKSQLIFWGEFSLHTQSLSIRSSKYRSEMSHGSTLSEAMSCHLGFQRAENWCQHAASWRPNTWWKESHLGDFLEESSNCYQKQVSNCNWLYAT